MLRRIGLLLPLLLVLAAVQPAGGAIGAGPLESAPAAQSPGQDASLRLDWVPGPHHIGPALALQRGYYAAEASIYGWAREPARA